jgi:RHS repeat-associated protein
MGLGTRVPPRSQVRPGLVRQVPPARWPPGPEDRPGVDGSRPPAGGTGGALAGGPTYYLRLPDGTLLGERVANGTQGDADWQFFLQDGHPGSVIVLLDEQGNRTAVFDYAPYGELISDERDEGEANTAWRFASQWFDGSSGLYKMGERYSIPSLGRWTQQDPLVQPESLREGNRFIYGGPIPSTCPISTGWTSGTMSEIGLKTTSEKSPLHSTRHTWLRALFLPPKDARRHLLCSHPPAESWGALHQSLLAVGQISSSRVRERGKVPT